MKEEIDTSIEKRVKRIKEELNKKLESEIERKIVE